MGLVVGLTGGIGSGKSAVAEVFRSLGVEVVDADEVAHELARPGGAGHRAVVQAFGPSVLAGDGTLDRAELRRRAFADPAFRARLEAAQHPAIGAEIRRRIDGWRGDYGVMVVPLLFERGGTASVADRTLVVDCPEETQVARVRSRSGLAEPEVRAIMATQLSRQERLRRADDVIDNSGPRQALEEAVRRLDIRYRALAARPADARP